MPLENNTTAVCQACGQETCPGCPVDTPREVMMTHFVGDTCQPDGHREEAKTGFKFDEEKHGGTKLRYDLIPPVALKMLAEVYTHGARKYGDINYLKGMSFRRILAALMRHIEAYRAGETDDPDSGLPHMAHAAWQCFTLMVYEDESLGDDDREMLKEEAECSRD